MSSHEIQYPVINTWSHLVLQVKTKPSLGVRVAAHSPNKTDKLEKKQTQQLYFHFIVSCSADVRLTLYNVTLVNLIMVCPRNRVTSAI